MPLYVGLIVAQAVYVFLFLKELYGLVLHVMDFDEQQIMLVVLGLIDVVMISNLLVMVIVGGYETFVSRLRLERHPDKPEWLSHVDFGVIKVKLAMGIIGISSISLLRTFVEARALGSPGSGITEMGADVADDHPLDLHPVGARHHLRRPYQLGAEAGARARVALGRRPSRRVRRTPVHGNRPPPVPGHPRGGARAGAATRRHGRTGPERARHAPRRPATGFRSPPGTARPHPRRAAGDRH